MNNLNNTEDSLSGFEILVLEFLKEISDELKMLNDKLSPVALEVKFGSPTRK